MCAALNGLPLLPASVTMTKFRDPAKLAVDFLTVAKLCHTVDGLYIWEFVTHLYYEWSVIRGQRPYRRTIWIYSMNRFAALIAVIINLTIMNLTTPTNCQAWITSSFVFVCITFSFSSLLIVLRTIAIWNKNKFVVGLAMGAWMISLSFTIQGIIQVRSSWAPAQDTCTLPVVKKNKLSFVVMLSIDFVLLLLMTMGLLRFRRRGGGRFGLGRLLWNQGVVYLLVVTIAELLPMVFICLDLNDAFDLMFMMPGLITVSIAATRMYRSLADYNSYTETVKDSGSFQRVFPIVLDNQLATAMPIPPNRMGVAVHKSSERWQPPAPMEQFISFASKDGELRNKPHGPCYEDYSEEAPKDETGFFNWIF